ncbi:hypothetical protein MAR_037478 [Mya arenaria]|uniref:DED domain-containing protein n=1 Tax=Mya arenaria TaxID=6604 RepID=A0ABY7FSG6_MYAAR|nr:uncharacterized protein LOC128213284 isoform X2 [Mya arenaria]WAR23809.1 hypothetical protein MAR_037478 [Mya arenaria]
MSNFTRSGPCFRAKLRKIRPFTALLLDVSQMLEDSELSHLKLAILTDGLVTKKVLSGIKHTSDLIRHLKELDIVNEQDTEYLENVLLKIGRRDVIKTIEKYHRKRTEATANQTVPKVIAPSDYTHIKSINARPVETDVSCSDFPPRLLRGELSVLSLSTQPEACLHAGSNESDDTKSNSQESAMSIDFSQENKCSQMSISDDEKSAYIAA